jgi:hypothetical protein
MCGRCLHSAGTELLSVDHWKAETAAWVPAYTVSSPDSRDGYAVLVSENFSPDEPESKKRQVGLCVQCLHMRQIQSDRGSIFYMCQLSASDATFPKYPRLPVLHCSGYKASHLKSPDKDAM